MADDRNPSGEARPLRRSYEGRLIAGVAAGIAEYLDVDVAVVRLAMVALTLLGGAGVPLYVAAWLFIPEEEAEQPLAADLIHRHVPA